MTNTEPHHHAHHGGHGHQGRPWPAPGEQSPTEFWENFYTERDQVWSGNPNDLLVREVADLPPGTVLDLGCAEGGDAVWLAEHGWRVTGVDVSATALARAAALAEARGVTGSITFERHDLTATFPEGDYDLVCAQYFHSPVEQENERQDALRKAAGAVRPGGRLLVISHGGWPTWMTEPPREIHFMGPRQLLDALRLDPARWQVELEDVVERPATSPDGVEGTRTDNVLRLLRLPA
ncbi:SAM-dependent methyltransferase [Actinokineospora inagensis]|uniref:SAM-dependent methyltransferase n=1 Tax=Actinokineospora inagensis TaxID=103730 RepID=UPI00041C24F2|nr:class I SAM-dependent methyltransferase [Actinokineospora inagensis]